MAIGQRTAFVDTFGGLAKTPTSDADASKRLLFHAPTAQDGTGAAPRRSASRASCRLLQNQLAHLVAANLFAQFLAVGNSGCGLRQ